MRIILPLSCVALLAGCMASEAAKTAIIHTKEQQAKSGLYKIGNPYEIFGKTYVPKEDPYYEEKGVASWYGPKFHGKKTANGEIFNKEVFSAAHRTLPIPSVVDVTNLDNGRKMQLRINDRGPFAHDRILDVSEAAARELGFHNNGTANVHVTFNRLATDRMLAGTNMHINTDKASRNSSYAARLQQPTIENAHIDTQTMVPTERYEVAKAGQITTGAYVAGAQKQPHNYYVAAAAAKPSYAPPAAVRSSIAKEQPNYAGHYYSDANAYEEKVKNAASTAENTAESYNDTAPASGGKFAVQLGAFKEYQAAEALKSRVSNAQIVTKNGVHKVQVGGFASRSDAASKLSSLKSDGFTDAFIAQR